MWPSPSSGPEAGAYPALPCRARFLSCRARCDYCVWLIWGGAGARKGRLALGERVTSGCSLLGGEQAVDRPRRQSLLDHHLCGAEYPGLAGGLGDDDPQVLRGQRKGSAVDDLANTGEEVLTDVGDHAADDDHRRVEQIDAARGDTADIPARLTHRMHSRGVPRTHQFDELGSALDLIALLAQRLHHGVPAGQRFEAALITASARNGPAAGYRDVTEVARSAVVPSPQLAIADDARADPGGHFDEDQILNVRPACPVLTQR